MTGGGLSMVKSENVRDRRGSTRTDRGRGLGFRLDFGLGLGGRCGPTRFDDPLILLHTSMRSRRTPIQHLLNPSNHPLVSLAFSHARCDCDSSQLTLENKLVFPLAMGPVRRIVLLPLGPFLRCEELGVNHATRRKMRRIRSERKMRSGERAPRGWRKERSGWTSADDATGL